jgi:hypothetical protein
MPYNKNKNLETIARTIRIPKNLNDTIESLALKDERDFSKQVIFMLKKYVEIHESFNIPKGNDKNAM